MRPLISPFVLASLLMVLLASVARGQQPFVTDDADTTPKHHFHFEFADELDLLPHTDLPNLRQNEVDFQVAYGLFDNVEVGVETPLLTIFSTPDTVPPRQAGLGDINLSLKYNFLKHHEKSHVPALALVFNLELPTGDTNRELGSGLADFYVNGILQESLTSKLMFRLNGGILFSGNQTTGVEGIKTRGTVYTGSGSFVRQLSPRLDLGIELFGAVEKNFELGKGQLAAQFGGNYQLRRNMTLDFGVVAGKFTASPRFGAKLGVSIDW